jgi:transposase, IS5 family
MAGQPGFFETDERLRALSAAGGPLERLAAMVDFELFRPELEAALARADRSRGARPPYDAVLMFCVLILVRATAKITLANLAYNMHRLVWIDSRAAPA